MACLFPNLKIVKIIMGTWPKPSDRSQSYFKLLWQVKDLTTFGLVKLVVSNHVAYHSRIEGCEYLHL